MKPSKSISAISHYIIKVSKTLEIWRLRNKSSMDFVGVDAHMLQDIGISDAQRFIGVNKEFWEK